MKKLLLSLLMSLMAFTTHAKNTLLGDVNGDGKVNVADVMMVVSFILGKPNSNFNAANADFNGDGSINVSDCMAIIKFILNGGGNDLSQGCPDDHHPHMIDLGLPSGTKWACCNVGANKPEEYGGYYAWGETSEKEEYTWENYVHCDGLYNTCHDIGLNISGTEYDVAHVNWGDAWQMPSVEQFKELVENCTYIWTTINDIEGALFKGNNAVSIFLPATGHLPDCSSDYWSCTQDFYDDNYASILTFDSVGARNILSTNRNSGLTVRPVASENNFSPLQLSSSTVNLIVGQQREIKITSGNGSYTVNSDNSSAATAVIINDTIIISGINVGTATLTVTDISSGQAATVEVTVKSLCPDDHHPHMIDLGLPSGTKWACCNVGADMPEGFGGYYAWGETEEKDVYNEVTYQYVTGVDEDGDGLYDRKREFQSIGSDISGTLYDVANVQWGGSWQMPTQAQFEELINNCYFSWIVKNGIYGYQITGMNGGKIFLPAAGWRDGCDLKDHGSFGNYWSGTHGTNQDFCACILNSNSFGVGWHFYGHRINGNSVRPVVVDTTAAISLLLSKTFLILPERCDDTIDIISSNNDFTAESSNEKIVTATIQNNTITVLAVGIGKATITVTDKKNYKTAIVNVTVEANQAAFLCPDNHHPHMIDLGLPSGTKWACCNVGATKPESYGGYYAWGETEEKTTYDWASYIHCDGSNETCHDLGCDIAGTLYDVAYVKWGEAWQIPSSDQYGELLNNCKYELTTINGIKGCLIKGKNGSSIFLPAGNFDGFNSGSCYYWTGTPERDRNDGATDFFFYMESAMSWASSSFRSNGYTVRPVISDNLHFPLQLSQSTLTLGVGEHGIVNIIFGSGNYTVHSEDPAIASVTVSNNLVTIYGNYMGNAIITVIDNLKNQSSNIIVTVTDDSQPSYKSCPDNNHPHIIDLGLPSGTKWACCNMDTSHPENQSPSNYGGYYAWGETEEKELYNHVNYQYSSGEDTDGDGWYDKNTNSQWQFLGNDIAGTEYDVACVNWGMEWKMPSLCQFKELVENCTSQWTTLNGINGRKFTGSNGGSIFLPASGHYLSNLLSRDYYGEYWSSTQNPYIDYKAYDLFISSDHVYWNNGDVHSSGYTVRPVVK